MRLIVEVFSGILILLLNVYTGLMLSVAELQVTAAENYKSSVVSEVENSNFNSHVIDGCIAEAAPAGYSLEVTACAYDEEHDIVTAEVALTYTYKIPLLGISETRTTRGVAR